MIHNNEVVTFNMKIKLRIIMDQSEARCETFHSAARRVSVVTTVKDDQFYYGFNVSGLFMIKPDVWSVINYMKLCCRIKISLRPFCWRKDTLVV